MNLQSAPRTRPATYQDVLDAPAHMVAQIVDGALHLHPRPASPHALAATALTGAIHGPYQFGRNGPGGWWIVFEPELHLGEQVLAPDLAGWRRERMPRFPRAAWFDLAPDWVCEVLSPSTRQLDLGPKRDHYGRAGVRWLWLIDPDARTLETFEMREGGWTLLATLTADAEVRVAPFDAIALPLGELWPPDDGDSEDDKPETAPVG